MAENEKKKPTEKKQTVKKAETKKATAPKSSKPAAATNKSASKVTAKSAKTPPKKAGNQQSGEAAVKKQAPGLTKHAEFSFECPKREVIGTGGSRAARNLKLVPCNLYGPSMENINFMIDEKEITKIYLAGGAKTKIFNLKINGVEYAAMAKEFSIHPVSERILHIDFIYLNEKEQKVELPVYLLNKDKSIGIKRGGLLNVIKYSLNAICNVANMPSGIEIDTANLKIGDTVRAANLNMPNGSRINVPGHQPIVAISGKKNRDEDEEVSSEAAVENKEVAAAK